jgi:hypothetical protein
MKQHFFYIHFVGGTAYIDRVSTVQTCATYVELTISELRDADKISLAGVASHKNPAKDGGVHMVISEFWEFD